MDLKFRALTNKKKPTWFIADENFPLSNFFRMVEIGELKRDTLGIYTGRQSKDGKDIFQGDLVMPPTFPQGNDISNNPLKLPEPKIVEWNDKNLCWNILPENKYYDIVGNIYDNVGVIK
jgi:hypothetical protein